MIDIDALAKPLVDLLNSFGSGVLPTGGPADALRATSAAVDRIHELGRSSINQVNTAWDGTAADATTSKALRVQTSAATISDNGTEMATVVNQAAAEVESGQKDLNGILQSFVSTATALGPAIATPPGLTAVIGSAIDHINQAVGVVGRVQNELDTHTASMTGLTPPPSTSLASTLASSGIPQQLLSGASGVASSAGSLLSTVLNNPLVTEASKAATPSATTPSPGTQQPDTGSAAPTRDGVEITLPDGSRVEAPNERAATAVQAALGTVGTPYVWGGNSPGAGLDCSGLTKYAYGEAGVELPRLAAEQGNGATQVSAGDLMPGDLAIWDGHVAMVIGNGQFVEAGDPVQISSVRTENSGMDFYGFYRPTS
ncbi:NlpC/P60 family protein [Nocardia sp. NPDC050697]|uniref:NlpC/P60 family protein n=1 Tax=Nocardia sp. NPDC050697 TaxID=3155158 RepID=UPI00340B579E